MSQSRTPSPSSSSPGAAAGTPVSYEAEAATVEGSARVSAYPGASGGRIVRNIGLWRGARTGTVRFTVTATADGRYSLTFFYVYLDEDTSRPVVITVSGAAPVTLTTRGGSSCCAAMTITVALRSGPNAISFTNPSGAAPSLDRIVLRPR